MGIEVAVAVALVSALATAYSQSEQSKAQTKVFESNQNSAIRSALDQYEAQGAQSNQRRDLTGQQVQQNALAAARARSTAQAAASDSNIAGLSVDQVMNEITGQEGTNYSNIAANEAAAQDQQTRAAAGITSQAQDRINSTQAGNFNPLIGLLQIGAAGAGTYAGYKAK